MQAFTEWLILSERYLWGLHILGIVLGLGAATVTDVMFFKFLKNYRIVRQEAKIMESLSKIVWIGFALLVLSGLAIFWPRAEAFLASPRFMMKMTLVGVIVINGTLLNAWVQPRMVKISFIEKERKLTDEDITKRERLRRFAFAFGAISLVSWYGAFALAVLDMIVLDYLYFLVIYLIVIIIAIVGSQLTERKFLQRAEEKVSGDEQLVT